MQTLEQVAQILNAVAEVSNAEVKRVFNKEKEIRRLRAYYNTRQEVTVRNGFPIWVWLDVRSEEQDVGYKDQWVAEAEITSKSYGSIKFLKLTVEEECNAINKAFDAYLCSR